MNGSEFPSDDELLFDDEDLEEVAPPGWEGTVRGMKKHKEIDNPFALAWSMKKRGAKSHKHEGVTMKIKLEQLRQIIKEELAGQSLNETFDRDAFEFYVRTLDEMAYLAESLSSWGDNELSDEVAELRQHIAALRGRVDSAMLGQA